MKTTITMDDELREKAQRFGINVSEACREAVGQRVAVAERLAELGDDAYETVDSVRPRGQGDETEYEKVQFMGRQVGYVPGRSNVWVTPKGAIVWESGQAENRFFKFYDDMDKFLADRKVPPVLRQDVERELLGKPKITFLDI